MSNFVIDSVDTALEAAQQYRDLGLPPPADLIAYLGDNGLILTDECEVYDYLFNEVQQDQ